MQFTLVEWAFLWGVLASAAIGFFYAMFLRRQVLARPQGTEKMIEVATLIQQGANAYLVRQFRTIALLVVILGVGLVISGVAKGPAIAAGRGIAFLAGCFGSAVTGYMGMWLAVRGNVRCAQAARTSLAEPLTIAFRSGSVAGMFTVVMGLLGATVIFMLFKDQAEEVLLGFGFGGCLLALFMRVGGGIFTKAADVGADLVGKVEAGIPEDDPRNAAVIADNVGDNVGDCAGMAADIFESYEVTLVAAMILALLHPDIDVAQKWIIFCLIVRGIGVLTSIVGTYLVKVRNEQERAMNAIGRGFIWSAVLSAIAFFGFAKWYVGDMRLFWATTAGLALAVVIYLLTEYYTATHKSPTQEVAESTQTGTATNILSGFAGGLESSVAAVLVICAAVGVSMWIFRGEGVDVILFGVSLCGLGMLTTTGVIVSMDSYGPIADNANGIGEMANLEDEARRRMDELDAVGNTTKAATKGFAIASAVIAAISLFGSYMGKVMEGLGEVPGMLQAAADQFGMDVARLAEVRLPITVAEPSVFIGLLIGGAMPFLFSSLTIRAVGRAAFSIINEVRRQFREIPGLWEGQAQPDSARCVDMCTSAAIRELIGPGLLAILMPIVIGCLLGWGALGGYLAGIIVTGQLMAVMLANSGAMWDNAKKIIEDGAYGGKGSETHKAAVVSDTVGDPFKDTAGPALNPLIKVMNLVAVLAVPLVVAWHNTPVGYVVGGICAVIVIGAVLFSRRGSRELETSQPQETLAADDASGDE
ncbi:MAG: sodium-translocating pyrophosphatase [Armatimonadota bacterium]|jgi:K(+)-stimulated pyrophosphate-energized sodium pump